MLDWINKENINAKDYASTYKGESVMYEGIATYKDESVFLSKDTLKKCMPNLKGRPVIIEHKLGIKPDNMEKYAVGYVTDCEYNNETGDFDCDFVTWNDEAKELLKNGYTLSTSYIPKEFGNGGTFINTPYDKEIKDLSFTHLAIVKNPRYEKVKVYMNSTEELNNDKWITKFDKEGELYHVNIDPSDDFKKGENKTHEDKEKKRKTQYNYGKKVSSKDGSRKGQIIGSVPTGTDYNGDRTYKYEVRWDDGSVERLSQDKLLFKETKEEIAKNIQNLQVKIQTFRSKGDLSEYQKMQEDYKNLVAKYIKLKDKEKAEPEKEVKEEKKETPQKTDLQEKEDKYNEALKVYKDKNKQLSETKDLPARLKIASELTKAKTAITKARRDFAEAVMKNFEAKEDTAYEDKVKARKERFEHLAQGYGAMAHEKAEQFRQRASVIPAGQPIHGTRDRNYREKTWDLLGKSSQLTDKANYYAGKAEGVGKAGISDDDKNAIAKLAEKYKNTSSSAERRRIIDRVLDLHRKSNMPAEKKKQETNLGFSIERNTDINRLQLKFGGKPDENTRSILKSSGFRWSPRENAWQRQLTGNAEWALRRVIDKMEKSKPENQNDINEEKENYCMDKIEVEQGFLKSLLDRVSKTLEFSNADDEEEILAAKEAEEKAKAEEEAKKKAEEEAKAKEEAEKAAKEKENSVDWFEKMQEVMNSNDRGEADKIKPAPNSKSALEKGKKIFG